MLRTLEWQYSDNKAMIGSLAHPNSEFRLDSSSLLSVVVAFIIPKLVIETYTLFVKYSRVYLL